MIEAKVIRDSVGPKGIRITTMVLTYPRFIHAEFMTHRVFSRNASSSRAIPVKKQIKMVRDNPAMPLAFAANKAGMQAGEKFGPFKQWLCRTIWLSAMRCAVFFATLMDRLNIHKQYANRILEPWAHITVVVTTTDWDNFFALRCHEMAQPEIHELADKMYDARKWSTTEILRPGQWHLPFIRKDDKYDERDPDFVKRSVARCARVSYLNHDGQPPTIEKDLELYNRLLGAHPLHASPAEHQAMALDVFEDTMLNGNLHGWLQYRKALSGENITEFRKD